jgi:hypothetical protein
MGAVTRTLRERGKEKLPFAGCSLVKTSGVISAEDRIKK